MALSERVKILLTGVAGFVGYHLAKVLTRQGGHEVVGIDNLNDYYPVSLKEARLADLGNPPGFRFLPMDLANREAVLQLFAEEGFDLVLAMGAQAGVRYSIENPAAYFSSNLDGFFSLLEGCRQFPVKHLIYASSSSVYGRSGEIPFSESQKTDQPVSFYAATKQCNEVMAHAYSEIYQIPATGLRFFTVYGPWGRPDMAPILFASAISQGKPIKVFNHGKMRRDFTYVGDVVEAIVRLMDCPPTASKGQSPCRVCNIGKGAPVDLMDFIRTLERHLQKEAVLEMHPMQPGDMEETFCDISRLQELIGYHPKTDLDTGIGEFVEWFRSYYES